MRCLSLAHALADDGWAVGFAVSEDTVRMLPALRRTSHAVAAGFDDSSGQPARLAACWPQGCDLLIVDHHHWESALEAAAAPWARACCVIDDLCKRSHRCDILIDPTLGRSPHAYAGLVPTDARILTGADYAVLRPEFFQKRQTLDLAPRAPGIGRVLVSVGLSDPRAATGPILHGLSVAGYRGALDVVLGAASASAPDVKKRLAADFSGARLHSHIDASAMASLLAGADLAIGAAGTSSYERCCLGVPALAVQVADNQADNMAAICEAGAAVSLGDRRTLTAARFAAAWRDLVRDSDRLAAMRRAALAVCDGLGAQRIALAIRPQHTDAGEPVTLRRATLDDARTMFQWQHEPTTRAYARNPQPPTWDEHVAWLGAKLADPRVIFSAIMLGDEPAGVVMLDACTPASPGTLAFEVSINVGVRHTRRGVGLAALRSARRLVPDVELHAHILHANTGSLGLFRKARYRPYAEGRYISRAD